MKMVSAGEVHPKPCNCHANVYKELVRCWAFEPGERPDFPSLVDFFSTIDRTKPGSIKRESGVVTSAAYQGAWADSDDEAEVSPASGEHVPQGPDSNGYSITGDNYNISGDADLRGATAPDAAGGDYLVPVVSGGQHPQEVKVEGMLLAPVDDPTYAIGGDAADPTTGLSDSAAEHEQNAEDATTRSTPPVVYLAVDAVTPAKQGKRRKPSAPTSWFKGKRGAGSDTTGLVPDAGSADDAGEYLVVGSTSI